MSANQKEEFILWKLEENAKKSEELKNKKNEKHLEYLKLKEEFESSQYKCEIENKKNSLLTLQEQHKRELDELKERHKKEREAAMSDYLEIKEKGKTILAAMRDELEELSNQLVEIVKENKQLNKDKQKLKSLEEIIVTNHAVVQYLDRAKGMNIDKIREKAREKMLANGSKIQSTTKVPDHKVVEYLVEEGIINLEQVEKEILPDNVKKLIMSDELLGSTGTFTTKGGFRLAVSAGKVVTFLPKKEKAKKINTHLVKREKRRPRKMKL
jgi:hypothetical protein